MRVLERISVRGSATEHATGPSLMNHRASGQQCFSDNPLLHSRPICPQVCGLGSLIKRHRALQYRKVLTGYHAASYAPTKAVNPERLAMENPLGHNSTACDECFP